MEHQRIDGCAAVREQLHAIAGMADVAEQLAVRIDHARARKDHAFAVRSRRGHQRAHVVGEQFVVVVEEVEPFAARGFERDVRGASDATSFSPRADQSKRSAAVFARQRPMRIAARGDDDDFQIRPGLPRRRIERALQRRRDPCCGSGSKPAARRAFTIAFVRRARISARFSRSATLAGARFSAADDELFGAFDIAVVQIRHAAQVERVDVVRRLAQRAFQRVVRGGDVAAFQQRLSGLQQRTRRVVPRVELRRPFACGCVRSVRRAGRRRCSRRVRGPIRRRAHSRCTFRAIDETHRRARGEVDEEIVVFVDREMPGRNVRLHRRDCDGTSSRSAPSACRSGNGKGRTARRRIRSACRRGREPARANRRCVHRPRAFINVSMCVGINSSSSSRKFSHSPRADSSATFAASGRGKLCDRERSAARRDHLRRRQRTMHAAARGDDDDFEIRPRLRNGRRDRAIERRPIHAADQDRDQWRVLDRHAVFTPACGT